MHKPQRDGFGKNDSLLRVGLLRDGIDPTSLREFFNILAGLCLQQRLRQGIQGNVQVGLPIERVAQSQMLVMQATEAEQFTRGDHDLLGYCTLEYLAHVHRRHRLQPETRPGHGHAVVHTPLHTRIQAVTHGVRLLMEALAQRLQVLVEPTAFVQPGNGALSDSGQSKRTQ